MGRACSIVGEMKNAYQILVRNSEEKIPLRKLIVDERIILKYIFRK
jgi:hypothetical protein